MSFLYVTSPTASLSIEKHQIVLIENDVTTKLPLEVLEGVVLIGNANMTAACARGLLQRGIPTTYLSSTGQYFGRLESTRHSNIERQRKQFRAGDNNAFCLALSRKIIFAKCRNQKVILQRRLRSTAREDLSMAIESIGLIEKKIKNTTSLNELLGYEGTAAKYYFRALGSTLNPPFTFYYRSRQPPLDPFNSMLSFGYTLLMYECYSALINKGFHPYAGFLHQDRRGHPSLASDIMEEWRAPIVDTLVLQYCDHNKVTENDFICNEANSGVFLSRPASQKFINAFAKRLQQRQSYQGSTDDISFRSGIVHQLNQLIDAIDGNDSDRYTPLQIR